MPKRPNVMFDSKNWWELCPAPWHPDHELQEGHACSLDGRCWVPATPEAFTPWRSNA